MNAVTPLPLLARLADIAAGRMPPPAATLAGERLARARLARTPRIGPVTFHEMLGHYGTAAAALDALPSLARRAGFALAPVAPPPTALHREAEALAARGGRFIVHGDADYPTGLAQIADAPPLLSAIGDPGLLKRPLLAVVGARNASTNGRRVAATLAHDLGAGGFAIVSGLARGIDTAAHQASLGTGTIAVLAGGIDVIYPPENADLYRALAAQGLVLSEAPLGAVPQARHFPRRNRIVSGLALGVLVVEAALQSGSLITARQAADQGRDVFAVPGSPLDPRCRGSNQLLRDGAHLVETAADVRAHLRPEPTPAATAPVAAVSPTVTKSDRAAHRRDRTGGGAATALDAAPQYIEKQGDFTPECLLACLGHSPTPVDEVIRECHVSPALVTAALLDLELSGRVERLQGNMVALI
ncbi:DNA-processing protein DprA [Vineibacter terrae]|uniref:DNA-processing protein DprA n=1 Tax=Vineibacter terrae TaxID=2586908 RepID=UPI002E2EEF8E|nr:DNA-processing protein DprA [Vineibacter terrae]HEX2885529.1 DNA-processing protein DprA [Vineibacter terrae]